MALIDSITVDSNKKIPEVEPGEKAEPAETSGLLQEAPENVLALNEKESQPPDVLEQKKPLWNAVIETVVAASSYQVINYLAWLLGFVFIFPILSLCIKRRAWGLMLFGLAVPAYNYALYLASFMFEARVLILYQLNSPLFAQIAFIWFLITGHMKSRAFGIFILLLACSTLLPRIIGKPVTDRPQLCKSFRLFRIKSSTPATDFYFYCRHRPSTGSRRQGKWDDTA